MPQYIANPIYDTAFKYMMQNERAAKVLISNLLDKEVDELTLLTNDVVLYEKDNLRILRLDFSAKIRDKKSGKTEIVTIEMQKAYLDREVMRFRDYLSSQYSSRINAEKRIRHTVAKNKDTGQFEPVDVEEYIPRHIIAIYFLGSGLDDLIKSDTPVIYNFPNPVGIDGEPIANAMDTLFFRALTHDTVVVRINKLKDNARSKVEQMLEIFVQDNVSSESSQLLEIKDFDSRSPEFKVLAMPLIMAVADSKLRKELAVEEELTDLLQIFDTTSDERDYYQQLVSEQATQLKEKDSQLQVQATQLQEKDTQLQKKATQLQEKDTQLQEKEALIAEYQKLLTAAGLVKI